MSNPNEELLKALDKLEAYTKETSVERTRFEEVKDILQGLFFSEYAHEKHHRKKLSKKELQKSVGVVKNYLPLIEKYRHGSVEEQKLAGVITRTIANYNDAIKRSDESDTTNLVILSTPSIAYKRGASEKKDIIDSLFSNVRSPSKPISKEEKDTLKMKAIRLIEGEDTFKESLIETIKDKELGTLYEVQNDGQTVTLMQTWSELPGEVHRIVGDFKRESKHSIPIKDSFKLYLESIQPGHPYPPQRMGWSLSHWLIPSSVIWIDQIPLLQPLLDRKNKAAQGLLPKGELNLKARKLFRFKKNVFDTSRLEYLSYHQELAQSIVRASSYGDEKMYYKVINNFFEALAKLPTPFEAFSRASEEMNWVFIEGPFERTEEIRLKGDFDDLFTIYDIQRENFEQDYITKEPGNEPFEIVKKEYLLQMGRLIGEASSLLLKLQLSEKIKVKPPPLSDFELKIQAAALKHLIEFLVELEDDADLDDPIEQEALKLRMRMEIGSEIELFSVANFEDIDKLLEELTEEIVSYYHAQFHAGDQ